MRSVRDFFHFRHVDPVQIFSSFHRNHREAEEAGVPVYTIFTNEQLALIITKRVHSKTGLRAIEGIGEARVEKYGSAIIQFMRELLPPEV